MWLCVELKLPHASSHPRPRLCSTTTPDTMPHPTLIHTQVGSLHGSGDELMKAVTGSELDPEVFLTYLRAK